jgi:hypothetical protein
MRAMRRIPPKVPRRKNDSVKPTELLAQQDSGRAILKHQGSLRHLKRGGRVASQGFARPPLGAVPLERSPQNLLFMSVLSAAGRLQTFPT